jgi:hypothetical protein
MRRSNADTAIRTLAKQGGQSIAAEFQGLLKRKDSRLGRRDAGLRLLYIDLAIQLRGDTLHRQIMDAVHLLQHLLLDGQLIVGFLQNE